MSLDFSSATYHPDSRAERISKCRAMAEEAKMLSSLGDDDVRERFLLAAKCWSELADELERGEGL
jgi:hypothetical protein